MKIRGNRSTSFDAYVTIKGDKDKDGKLMNSTENYKDIDNFRVRDGRIIFDSPSVSATTFFGK